MNDDDIGFLSVVAICMILIGAAAVVEHDANTRCTACFDKWNTEHNTTTILAMSSQPIYNGEFVLCESACESPLDRIFRGEE